MVDYQHTPTLHPQLYFPKLRMVGYLHTPAPTPVILFLMDDPDISQHSV